MATALLLIRVEDSVAMRRGAISLVVAAMAVVASCSSGAHRSTSQTTGPSNSAPASPTTPISGGGAEGRVDAAGTVWLCRPGVSPDPCRGDLDATAVSATGSLSSVPASPESGSRFDCFYVYPTISGERGPNSDLAIQDGETGIARLQAARFSQLCDVWAPMYRQVTIPALFTGGLPAINTAYRSLLEGWRDYLHNFNHGRPIVFIGHSQGAAMLIRLLAAEVDPDPQLRARTVVAMIIGGNVQVATGQTTGGSFQHLPLCTSPAHTGCVIAYSTFPSEPPDGAFFGRPGQGVSLMSLQLTRSGQQVACVNPSAIGGGAGWLVPFFPSPPRPQVGTPWVTYPRLYTASCESRDGASWLQVNHVAVAGDPRPAVTQGLGPSWGYHGDDMQLTNGNLVEVLRAEEAAYGH